jgi:hypothetical protein
MSRKRNGYDNAAMSFRKGQSLKCQGNFILSRRRKPPRERGLSFILPAGLHLFAVPVWADGS